VSDSAVPPAERSLTRVYVAVVLVEIVTLVALWWVQSHFGRA
jgi:ABC-type branched-subunit amino acid transport system permease subunit